MRHLMEEGGETVNLAVEDEGEAVYLAQIECRQMMRAFALPNESSAHCSAVGKAILSAASNKRLSKILHQRGMPRLTVKTITTPALLRQELERVRAAGYAVDDEEHAVGLRCIAAPIFDETGDVVAAVSASGPMARVVEERIAGLGALVLEASRAISAEMGAPPAIASGKSGQSRRTSVFVVRPRAAFRPLSGAADPARVATELGDGHQLEGQGSQPFARRGTVRDRSALDLRTGEPACILVVIGIDRLPGVAFYLQGRAHDAAVATERTSRTARA